MRKNTKIIILATSLGLSALLYQPMIDYLISQAANPNGFIGYVMTKIWNNNFKKMTTWGLEQINYTDGDIILDIGCGGGETINTFASDNPNSLIYGIDISNEAVRSSIETNQTYVNNKQVLIQQADVASLPFETESFALITAFQTHFYWDDLKQGLNEIYRCLNQNGTLLIVSEKDKIDYHMREYYAVTDMNDLLTSIGFKNIDVIQKSNWIAFIAFKIN